MKKYTFLFLMLLIGMHQVAAQQVFKYETIAKTNSVQQERNQLDLGLGLGIDLGGLIGAQLEYIPIKHLGLFASGGFYFIQAGWQLGVKGYIMPKITAKPFRVYVTGMYGTNAAIYIVGSDKYNAVYTGSTFGAGMEIRFGKKKTSGLNVALLYPVRAQEYEDNLNAMKSDPGIQDIQEPLPVGLSVAYHFEF